jgi:putative dehydrogenase
MNNNKNIGVIGVGSMGMAIALNLQDKGYQVAIRDIRSDIETTARHSGLTVCSSPAAIAAHADFIIIMVVNAKQTSEVLFGDHGIVSTSDAGKTILLCPTIAPEDTETIAQRLKAAGFNVLDGPVSGGPVRARNGTMSLMLAGDAKVIARHEVVLNAISSRLFRLGERIGDGARYKLVNNLVAGMNLIASSSAVALGVKMGLDPHTLVSLMSASSGQSMMLEDRLTRAIAGDYAPRAYAYILTKDVALGLDMAESAKVDMPMARHALDIFTATLARGYDEQDDAAVLKTLLE